VEKHLGVGEVVSETSAAFTLSDLSQVWVTFGVFPKDLNKVQVGRPVKVSSTEMGTDVMGTVAYVGNLLGEQTRTAMVRVNVPNPDDSWRPGLFVAVQVATDTYSAPVTVPVEAIQTVEDKPSLFVRTAEGFATRHVELGVSENGFVEVRQGLEAGAQVAAVGSFVLKSELGKASAEHAH
jgi:cobalt-zinc-cadmium efflux system membrane fusion protein